MRGTGHAGLRDTFFFFVDPSAGENTREATDEGVTRSKDDAFCRRVHTKGLGLTLLNNGRRARTRGQEKGNRKKPGKGKKKTSFNKRRRENNLQLRLAGVEGWKATPTTGKCARYAQLPGR